MKSRRTIFLFFCFSVMGLAAWRSFYFEEQRIETGRSAPPLKATLKRIFVRPDAPVVRLDELRRRGGRLGMSPQDERECWQIIRGLTETQVRGYLEEIPVSQRQQTDDVIRQMLYARWAQIDPQTPADQLADALKGGKNTTFESYCLREVLATWLKQDPAAAIQWAAGKKDEYIVNRFAGGLIGQLWVRENPATAVEKARAQAPFALSGIADVFCRNAGSGEMMREQLFSLIRDPEVSKRAKMWIEYAGRNWAGADTEAALKSTERYGMNDEEYASFRSSIYSRAAETQPIQVLDRLKTPSGMPGEEKSLSYIFGRLSTDNPQQAVAWAAQNNRPDLLGESVKNQVRYLIAPNPDGPDAGERIQALALNYQAWNRLDPEAAAAWIAEVPGSVRTKLTTSSSDGSR